MIDDEIGAGKKAVTISTMASPIAGKTCLTCHTDFVEVARWRHCPPCRVIRKRDRQRNRDEALQMYVAQDEVVAQFPDSFYAFESTSAERRDLGRAATLQDQRRVNDFAERAGGRASVVGVAHRRATDGGTARQSGRRGSNARK